MQGCILVLLAYKYIENNHSRVIGRTLTMNLESLISKEQIFTAIMVFIHYFRIKRNLTGKMHSGLEKLGG